ncbi:MAG: serine/threonine protein kinase [Anaerolineae bacterium]|nr:serine/threonine protein kinase [Anaerolineae bacterium]
MSRRLVIANRFEIGDESRDLLNRGSVGNVYRGLDTQTGRPVAVKMLKPDLIAGNPELVARFIREGDALHQLNHPNIVKMIAAIQDKGRYYLITEYIHGSSLRELLEARGALPVPEALEIAIPVASALTHAHQHGIIHRDLKPANILLAEDGTPYLTDFSVAYIADSTRLTRTGTRLGTVNYFSPEACNGERLDERADVWAMGVILYEMLTGSRPFAGRTIGETAMAILTRPLPALSRLCPEASPTLIELIEGMLEKDRYKRIPRMQLVEEGLRLEAALYRRGSASR